MEWKQTILNQLQERNRQERNVYEEIVKHYNRVIENYSKLFIRFTERERDILTLCQNTDAQIENASAADLPVNNKMKALENGYKKVKDEILTLLRERGDMTREETKRNVEETDEKYYAEQNKNQILTNENASLKQQLESANEQLRVLKKAKQDVDDELLALQLAYTQLQECQKELYATIAVLRQKMTEKIQEKCDALDEEVKLHE
ncbi:unnamed protein product, partial [Rotaria sp. Silwood2]